jgi:hypothetical protein
MFTTKGKAVPVVLLAVSLAVAGGGLATWRTAKVQQSEGDAKPSPSSPDNVDLGAP